MLMIRPLLFASLLLLSPGSALAAQEANTLVRYDLRPVTPRLDAASSWVESLESDLARPREEVELADLYERAAPEVVLEVVTRILGDELLEQGRTVALDGGSHLLVHAPARVHERIRGVLEALGRAFSSSERVRMDVFQVPAGAADDLLAKAVLSSEEGGRLRAQALDARPARTLELELLPGRTSVVDQTRSRPLVVDYDAEIAQGSVAFDPDVLEVSEGLRVLARGARTGRGTALSMVIESSRIASESETRALRLRAGIAKATEGGLEFLDGPKALEGVQVDQRSLAFSTIVPSDGVLALSTRVGGDETHEVVLLQRIQDGGVPFSTRAFGSMTLMLVNSELFGLPRFAFLNHEGRESLSQHPGLRATLESEPPSFLFEWMRFRFSVWRRLGPWAIVVTDPAWDNQAATELEQLFASLEAPSALVPVEIELAGADGRSVGATLPILVGTRCAVHVGSSDTALVDYDVEVANFATVPDPTVVPVFEGLSMQLGISEGVRRLVELSGSGRFRRDPGPGKAATAAAVGPFTGPIEPLTVDRLSFDERAELAPGAAEVTLGSSRQEVDEASALRVRVRVR